MSAWLAVIGSVLACFIGIWKYYGRKAKERRERIEAADKQFKEGVEERDPSKIIGSADRFHNDV